MTTAIVCQTTVAEDVLLDGRLALLHQRQGWMAVADLHFGYEISQRAAGRLMPFWGMEMIERQLTGLLDDYRPRQLVVLGDLVHDGTARIAARELVTRLSRRCDVIILAGNHDRQLADAVSMQEDWRTEGFHFHHGHCELEAPHGIQVIGHHHPAGAISDGAGLRLKLPAFVQQGNCWIMPAFSPWAAGTPWDADAASRIWLCTPQRILPFPQLATTAS